MTAIIVALGGLASLAIPAEQAGLDLFESKIRPVLVEHCYRCHAADSKRVKGELLLDTREGIRRGGETGPSVVPGKPDESLLIEALRYADLEMPPDRKLPDSVVADFVRWIEMGAPDPRESDSPERTATESETEVKVDVATAREHWSFRAPERQPLPAVQRTDWPHQPIDSFILARLEAEGLEPSSPADRRTLVRRVTFDLTGLPPTPQEVAAFVEDDSPHAYEKLVDRLLASPALGERWTRPWLDLARYAEDQAHIVGNDERLFYPNAYLYRDWVIEAIAGDMPFDRFVERQLAADLTEPESNEHVAALGFIGLGPKYYSRGSLAVQADEWEDRVDTVTRGLLGLTVACARCHDHKYDPITTADYYALAGVFASTEMFNRPLDDKREKAKNGHAKSAKDAVHVVRDTKPRDLNVFVRGDVNSKGPVVKRRFLAALSDGEPQPFASGSGRAELAAAIIDPQNPLTARVFVNRMWSLVFGRALVSTPSNFGRLGATPTHPELLDDLAARFRQRGGSPKMLLRELVLSATYRQSNAASAETIAADPANRLLGRMSRRRLDVEAWRDSLLMAAGRLERAVGGASVNVGDPDVQRRTVYGRTSRFELDPLLALFDFPDPNVHAEARTATTTPLQKLFVLNSPFVVKQAERLAERLLAMEPKPGENPTEMRITVAYLALFARPPSADQRRLGSAFLEASVGEPKKAWRQYAHALLASNELLFLD